MKPAVAIAVDGACVVAFALIGRASHAEAFDLVGLARTAGPFLAGTAVGTLLGRTWRHPLTLRSGIAVWAGTLAGGMLLRAALTGGGIALSFVIVAGITLAVFLLGWRLVAAAVSRRRVGAEAALRQRSGQIGPYRYWPVLVDRVDRPARLSALLGADQGPDEDDPLALLA